MTGRTHTQRLMAPLLQCVGFCEKLGFRRKAMLFMDKVAMETCVDAQLGQFAESQHSWSYCYAIYSTLIDFLYQTWALRCRSSLVPTEKASPSRWGSCRRRDDAWRAWSRRATARCSDTS